MKIYHQERPTYDTVSQWAQENRVIPPGHTASGKWNNDIARYQIDIMNAFNDPTIHTVVVKSASPMGNSEMILNIIGANLNKAQPAPMLVIQPTKEHHRFWEEHRLHPSLAYSGLGGWDVLKRQYFVSCGADELAAIVMRPVQMVLCDEPDRFPINTFEGHPALLANRRSLTFDSRKLGLFGCPGTKGQSLIEEMWLKSDQRRYFAPCPHCREYQTLEWSQMRWENAAETAFYECLHCREAIDHADKQMMGIRAEWRATKPHTGIAGFHINKLWSPWEAFSSLVESFVRGTKNPDYMKVFCNCDLAEVWEG